MNIKRAILSGILVWILGVSAFSASHFFTFMEDPEMQANLVLFIALIPCALLGVHVYYRTGYQTNGFKLGVIMFMTAIFLDAIITVPLFIIPKGGNHSTFFTDPGFWMIAAVYITVVTLYWRLGVSKQPLETSSP